MNSEPFSHHVTAYVGLVLDGVSVLSIKLKSGQLLPLMDYFCNDMFKPFKQKRENKRKEKEKTYLIFIYFIGPFMLLLCVGTWEVDALLLVLMHWRTQISEARWFSGCLVLLSL